MDGSSTNARQALLHGAVKLFGTMTDFVGLTDVALRLVLFLFGPETKRPSVSCWFSMHISFLSRMRAFTAINNVSF